MVPDPGENHEELFHSFTHDYSENDMGCNRSLFPIPFMILDF